MHLVVLAMIIVIGMLISLIKYGWLAIFVAVFLWFLIDKITKRR
jgi:hypothetical protein